ncbi:FecR family protein [Flavobacterium sp. W22_SRS_FK3]|uniref:FecR family protein n=1 Tax=Flavobacterium sp. W22_SRS_FK3 TaxID=3240275 RepID=UPI003F93D1F4
MYKKVFEELFEGYLQHTLSEVEEQQLMEMIRNGMHDDFIQEKISFLLRDHKDLAFLEKEKGDNILTYILSDSSVKVIPIREKSSKKTLRTLLAIAAAITVLFAVRNIFFYKSSPDYLKIDTVEQSEERSPVLAFSGKQLIHLPDGSTILLNENSSVQYNQDSFNDKTREVTLSGEAYFDIKRNITKPFIVHTGKVQTKVLGTAFNINAYKSSKNIQVTVTRGKVQVGDLDRIYGIITPNQQIVVNKSTLVHEQNNVNAAIAVEWKSNYLILDDLNMKEAVTMISEKYKVKILLSNEKIKNCRITASFLNEEDLDHVLKVICSVIETNYHNENGVITLDGKGCE